jgi:hypothetical protein
MPSVDLVMPMTARVVILPRPAGRREEGSPTLDLVCRERTAHRARRNCTGATLVPFQASDPTAGHFQAFTDIARSPTYYRCLIAEIRLSCEFGLK